MNDIVDTSPLRKYEGGLQSLHNVKTRCMQVAEEYSIYSTDKTTIAHIFGNIQCA